MDLGPLRSCLLFSFTTARSFSAAGFTGVDIFFTNSGFVIARSILSDIRAGSFNVANFYSKRIRRILPEFVALMIATTIAATVLLLPSDLIDYGLVWLLRALSCQTFASGKPLVILQHQRRQSPSCTPGRSRWKSGTIFFAPIRFWAIYQRSGARWFAFLAPFAILSLAGCMLRFS